MVDRRQARIDRRLERQLRDSRKSARLVADIVATSEPRTGVLPADSPAPRVVARPESIMSMRMTFDILSHADRADQWSWGQHRNWCSDARQDGDNCQLRATLIHMAGLKWAEILTQLTGNGRRRDRRKKHHSQSFSDISGEAQSRWIEIGREEDELFRFRCGGQQRIWGARQGSQFLVVWWDPEHKICPVERS